MKRLIQSHGSKGALPTAETVALPTVAAVTAATVIAATVAHMGATLHSSGKTSSKTKTSPLPKTKVMLFF